MTDDSIDDLCRAFALQSLDEKPVCDVAPAVDRSSMITTTRQLFQALLSQMAPNDSSYHLSHGAQLDFEGDTTMGNPTTGKFSCF